MRYSFHGKVRATGQQVDGYVEAETSTEAIDRLADQGIIGVYSVRAEPKQPRNAVLVAGTPEFERALLESAEPGQRQKRKALPSARNQSFVPVEVPVAAPPPPPPVEPPVVALAAPVPGVSDGVMLQLVDKLTILIGQMQKFLDRPAQVIYQSGGGEGRGGGGGGKKKATSRNISDAQNSTLRDIFQNNLDLRRSLEKLANTVTPEAAPANGTPAPASEPVAHATEAEATGPTAELLDGSPEPVGGGDAFGQPVAVSDDSSGEGSDGAHELAMSVTSADHDRHAQPAA